MSRLTPDLIRDATLGGDYSRIAEACTPRERDILIGAEEGAPVRVMIGAAKPKAQLRKLGFIRWETYTALAESVAAWLDACDDCPQVTVNPHVVYDARGKDRRVCDICRKNHYNEDGYPR